MPLLLGNTTSLKRTIFALFLGLLLIWTPADAAQLVGRVIDRNGASQGNCQIEFYAGSTSSPIYRATSNNEGNFYLNDPRPGTYHVVVRRGAQQFSIQVTIDASGLHPSTLIANW
jgi:Carboxypeptidase regulatory-like domain